MNHSQQLCDPELLEEFLQGGISERRERELTSHLDECPSCQLELEAKAAEPVYWRETSELLMGGFHRHRESASFGSRAPDSQSLSQQTQSVLATLAPTDDPQMLGRLGAYEVSGVIGAGGMGVVLKAQDRSLDRTVAIKVMSPHLASCGSARTRFAREAKAAAAVLHPNVIAIHGVANDRSLPYLVMPYIRGVSLQKRIDAEGPLPLIDTLRIGAQIAAGLAAAHAQGLVHRDIKPANILLEDGVERVAITDFGLARAVDDATMTRSGVIAGTPQYMSPEQARGEPIDQRSDLFSLGSVLFAVCSGRPPFRAETTYGVMRRITDDEPTSIREINPDVPEWLCAIIAKLLAKRPEDRFASAGEVAELLGDCLAHVQQPTTVPLPNSIPVTTGSRNRRPPLLKLLAWAAFALSLIFAGVLVVLELNKGTLTIECEADDVPIRIMQGDEVVKKLTVTKGKASVRIAAGNYVVEIDGRFEGITINDETVSLLRGDDVTVKIVRHNDTAAVISNNEDESPVVGERTVREANGPPLVQTLAQVEAQLGDEVLVPLAFLQPLKAKVTLTRGEDQWIVFPGTVSFPTGQTFGFKLSEIPNYPGVELWGSFELPSSNKLTQAYLEHKAIPIQFTSEDLDQAMAGNMVTRVSYLPNAENAETARAEFDSLLSYRLGPGTDPIAVAQRRGAILVVLRLGNRSEAAAKTYGDMDLSNERSADNAAACALCDVLRERLKLLEEAHGVGEASLLEVLTCLKALAEAEVAAANSSEQRQSAGQRQVDVLKQLKTAVEASYKANEAGISDVLAIEADLLKAQAELHQGTAAPGEASRTVDATDTSGSITTIPLELVLPQKFQMRWPGGISRTPTTANFSIRVDQPSHGELYEILGHHGLEITVSIEPTEYAASEDFLKLGRQLRIRFTEEELAALETEKPWSFTYEEETRYVIATIKMTARHRDVTPVAETQQLNGTWRLIEASMVSERRQELPFPGHLERWPIMVVNTSEWVCLRDGNSLRKMEVTYNLEVSPQTVDLKFTSQDSEQHERRLFELHGDTLITARRVIGLRAFPTSFNEPSVLIERYQRVGVVTSAPAQITQGGKVVEKTTITQSGDAIRIAAFKSRMSVANANVRLKRGGQATMAIVRPDDVLDASTAREPDNPGQQGTTGRLYVEQQEFDKSLSEVDRSSMRDRGDASFRLEKNSADARACLVITASDDNGEFLNFQTMMGGVLGPDRQPIEIQIRQVAPGRYVGDFNTPSAGEYFVFVKPDPDSPSLKARLVVETNAEDSPK